jgi:8-oxo-dGTP pyrophosphatase MutT (NUDIX family)
MQRSDRVVLRRFFSHHDSTSTLDTERLVHMGTRLHIVNVEAAVYRDDRYLMVRRGQGESHMPGTLSLVGGGIETRDETGGDVLRSTLRREIIEEVGVTVRDMTYLTGWTFQTDDGMDVVNLLFLCAYDSGIATPADPNEVEEVHWMRADEILTHPDAPSWTRNAIKKCEEVRATLSGASGRKEES